jgi:hypothetical protein
MKRSFRETEPDLAFLSDQKKQEQQSAPKKSALKKTKPSASGVVPTPKKVSSEEQHQVLAHELKQGNKLFVFQLAEDWVRDVLLTGLTGLTSGDISKPYNRHLPSSLWDRFSVVPTFQFFSELSVQPDTDVLVSLHTFYPQFLKELATVIKAPEGQALFLTFIFRFCHTFLVKRELLVKWNPSSHFGLYSRKLLKEDTVLQSCWGERVPVAPCESIFFAALPESQTTSCFFKTTEGFYAVFGPLALINFSCNTCFNVILTTDKGGPKKKTMSLGYPLAALKENQFKGCLVVKKIGPEQELLCYYKPLQTFTCLSVSHHYLQTL